MRKIRTDFFPGTVTRSDGLCPCTSALGLITRSSSAAKVKPAPSSKLTVRSTRSLSTLSSVGQGSPSAISLAKIDLALDHVMQSGALPGQHHLDLQHTLAAKAFLPHHPLDRLLRGDAHFLEELPHRHVEPLVIHGAASLICPACYAKDQ